MISKEVLIERNNDPIAQLLDKAIDAWRKQESDKLQACFKTAYQQYIDFLNDSEKIIAYNEHVLKMLEQYPELENHYLITPEKTALFEQYKIDAKIDSRDGYTENAFCASWENHNIEGPDLNIEIWYGSNRFYWETNIERIKTIHHELHHAYHAKGIREVMHNRDYFLNLRSHKHIGEFCSDTAADVITPWPLFGDIRVNKTNDLKKINLKKYNDTLHSIDMVPKPSEDEAEELRLQYLELMTYREKYTAAIAICSDMSPVEDSCDTHPSDKAFLLNSKKISDKMADTRVNKYLDHIYDGYVPEYGVAISPVHWSALTNQPEHTEIVGQEVFFTELPLKPKTLLQKFGENIIHAMDRTADFYRKFIPKHITDPDIREKFAYNACGITWPIPMVAGMNIYQALVSKNDLRTASIMTGLSILATAFFAARHEIMKVKYKPDKTTTSLGINPNQD